MKSHQVRVGIIGVAASLLCLLLGSVPAAAASTPQLVRNINQQRSSWPKNLTIVGDRLFFTAKDKAHGRELWITDGTAAGTRRIKDIRLGSTGSTPRGLTQVGGLLFFTANDGVHGRELWRSDGTPAGTRMIKDIESDPRDGGPQAITNVDGTAFFFQESQAVELWTSDGTLEGTHFVTDIDPGSPEYPDGITGGFSFGGHFFFQADDHVNGFKLWISDGTALGTRIVPGSNDGAALFTAVGDTLFFTAGEDGFGGRGMELWTTDADGTAASFVATVHGAYEMVTFKGKAFFTNNFLWKSNGTAPGTKPVDAPGGFYLTPIGKTLFFAGGIDHHGEAPDGVELWATDGTAGGSHMVKDINRHGDGDLSSSLPSHLTNLDGQLYFTATRRLERFGPGAGFELWTSDGTAAGTHEVADLNPSGGSAPSDLTALEGVLYFTADDGIHGRELWRYAP